MKQLLKIIISIIFTILLQTILGQTKVIVGIVKDKDGKPLQGAKIQWKDGSAKAKTNEEGVFEIKQKNDSVSLLVSKMGFYNVEIPASDIKPTINITLFDKTLTQIVITDKKANKPEKAGEELIDKCELNKLACCNLAESFENSNTLDVIYTDGIMGGREIQMLGLNGVYSQQLWDGMPYHRGLTQKLGLELVPGIWIDKIGINKGIGSVTNGFENITGQINIDYIRPKNTQKLLINGYISEIAKTDFNAISGFKVAPNLYSNVFAHTSFSRFQFDNNHDGFMDMPQFLNFNLMNKWHLITKNGFVLNGAIQWARNDVEAGMMDHHKYMGHTFYKIRQMTQEWQSYLKTAWELNESKQSSVALTFRLNRADQSGFLGNKDLNSGQWFGNFMAIYQTNLWNEKHLLKAGTNYHVDLLNEKIGISSFEKKEHIVGGFGEYTYNTTTVKAVLGFRTDYHNTLGIIVTPRADVRFLPSENHTFRYTLGLGYRTPAMLSEMSGFLISNRNVTLPSNTLEFEKAWSNGIVYNFKYNLFGFRNELEASAFLTLFENQLIFDVEQVGELKARYLKDGSRAQTVQLENKIFFSSNADLKLSYRSDYTTAILGETKQMVPLVKTDKFLANLALSTNNQKWRLSSTLLLNGSSRIANTSGVMPQQSPWFALLHSQINFVPSKKWDVYFGCENIFNFMQHNRIVSASNPDSPTFDGGMIWGPMDGRRMYVGFKWVIE